MIHVYAHSLNSVPGDFVAHLPKAPLVLLTNVLYTDDAAMQQLLDVKRAAYPAGARFTTSPHSLAAYLTNVAEPLVVVDNLNLWLSNTLLRFNSRALTYAATRAALFEELHHLRAARDTLAIQALYILTSDVDLDFYIRSPLGRLYQPLLFDVNAFVGRYLADTWSVLMNGVAVPTRLWS